MTKIKKTLALVMVLVIAMSSLILPVAAAETDVEPAAAVARCRVCDGDFKFEKHCDVVYETKVEAGITYVRYHRFDVYSCVVCGYTQHINLQWDLYWTKLT